MHCDGVVLMFEYVKFWSTISKKPLSFGGRFGTFRIQTGTYVTFQEVSDMVRRKSSLVKFFRGCFVYNVDVYKLKAYRWGITWFLELQGTQKPRRTAWKRNQPRPIQKGKTYVSLYIYTYICPKYIKFSHSFKKIWQNELLVAEIEYMQKRVSNVSSSPSNCLLLGVWVFV